MAFSFLTQELAMDLGTANTVIFQNDQIVLDEPSIVAIDNNTGKALALGQKAKLMQERENPGIKTVRPMKDGVIADFNAAEMMIRGFIKQVNSKRRSIFTPNIKMVVGIPSGSTEVEIRAVRDSSEHAGGRDVYLIYEPMASALGIGLDVEAPKGNMVVDIGGGTTEIAVISLGGIVVQDSIKVAGDVFTGDIQQHLRQQHNIRVGQITAEKIKIAIGAVLPDLDEEPEPYAITGPNHIRYMLPSHTRRSHTASTSRLHESKAVSYMCLSRLRLSFIPTSWRMVSTSQAADPSSEDLQSVSQKRSTFRSMLQTTRSGQLQEEHVWRSRTQRTIHSS